MEIATLAERAYLACPMCLSGAEGKTLVAANSAILALLVVLVGVLGSFIAFILYLARRAKGLDQNEGNPSA